VAYEPESARLPKDWRLRNTLVSPQFRSLSLSLCSLVSRLSLGPRLTFQLDVVSVNNGHNQPWKTLLDFCAARGVVHLDAPPFAPNQARFSKGFEVLREGRSRYRLFADPQKVGAILRTLGTHDVGVDGYAYGVG